MATQTGDASHMPGQPPAEKARSSSPSGAHAQWTCTTSVSNLKQYLLDHRGDKPDPSQPIIFDWNRDGGNLLNRRTDKYSQLVIQDLPDGLARSAVQDYMAHQTVNDGMATEESKAVIAQAVSETMLALKFDMASDTSEDEMDDGASDVSMTDHSSDTTMNDEVSHEEMVDPYVYDAALRTVEATWRTWGNLNLQQVSEFLPPDGLTLAMEVLGLLEDDAGQDKSILGKWVVPAAD